MSGQESMHGELFRVRGQVQGVGFRPHAWRLARDLGIRGEVCNDRDGVLIRAWAGRERLDRFARDLVTGAPPMARVEALLREPLAGLPETTTFRIGASADGSGMTRIAPDAATCAACVAELRDPGDRRYRHPFTSCTDCGPRLSILRGLPYDRAATSMAAFPLCAICREEFESPEGRRFHAQPLACPDCGPRLQLRDPQGGLKGEAEAAVTAAVRLLRDGAILAVKATGGWQLACDATNDDAVSELRRRKQRPGKPLAMMVRNCAVADRYAILDDAAREALQSAAAPVVVVAAIPGTDLAAGIAPGLIELGFMLPHSGLHHLLLEDLDAPLVMTSGNRAGEPQATDDADARDRLAGVADAFLGHDREIVHRVDDSVVRVSRGVARVLRAGRGLAPLSMPLPAGLRDGPAVLAMGAHLKNCFALAEDGRLTVSQHVGDLGNAATEAAFRRSLALYRGLYRSSPRRIAVDLHPDYRATRCGEELAQEWGAGLVRVQHHHAHLASCLLDNGIAADHEPVLGVMLDGLGMGADGAGWGGEFLLGGYRGYERLGTFKPVAMPGGSLAMRQPWRNTYAHLVAELGWPWLRMNFAHLDLFTFLDGQPRAALDAMIASGTGAPVASSCGRLFDAVAAAIGICRQESSYEGQAAMELEAAVDPVAFRDEPVELAYPFAIPRLGGDGLPYIEPQAMWQALLGDLHLGTPRGVIAARFHRGLARAIVAMVMRLANAGDVRRFADVALSGGVFQNRVLLEQVSSLLEAQGFRVLLQARLPAGDGGIAAGQAAVALAAINGSAESAAEAMETGGCQTCA